MPPTPARATCATCACFSRMQRAVDGWMSQYSFLRTAPRELLLTYVLKFLESYSYYSLAVTMTLYLSQEFGFSDSQAGWTYGLMGMLTSVYGFFIGFLIDNLGVKYSLVFGFGLLLVSRIIYGATRSVGMIHLVVYLTLPLGSALGIPVMTIGIRRYTSEKGPDRQLAYALFYESLNLASVTAAPAIDGFRRIMRVENEKSDGAPSSYLAKPYRLLIFSGCIFTFIAFLIASFGMRPGIQVGDSSSVTRTRAPENERRKDAPAMSKGYKGHDMPHSGSEYDQRKKEEEAEEELRKRTVISTSASTATIDETLSLGQTYPPSVSESHELQTFELRQGTPWDIMWDVVSNPRFWRFFLFVFLLTGVRTVYRHLEATFPKYMRREMGEHVLFGTIMAINPGIVIILVPIISPMIQKYESFWVILAGAAVTSVAPLWLVLGPSYMTAILFIATLSVGESMWSPRLYQYTMEIAEKGREGTYISLGNVPNFLATLSAGVMSGYLLEKYCPAPDDSYGWEEELARLSADDGNETFPTTADRIGPPHPPDSAKMWLIIALCSMTCPVVIYLLRNVIMGKKEGLCGTPEFRFCCPCFSERSRSASSEGVFLDVGDAEGEDDFGKLDDSDTNLIHDTSPLLGYDGSDLREDHLPDNVI